MKSIVLFLLIPFSSILYSQQDFECGMQPGYFEKYPIGYQVNPPQIGGMHAPAKTLNGAYVRIFYVFAQFSGDNKNINDANWPKDSMPIWANSFIGTNPNQAPFPINTISNYFYAMSNGQNIIIGYVHPQLIIINGSINQDYGRSNRAVLQQIDQTVNFQNYDQWRMMANYQQTFNQTDIYVDALYIIWRNIGYRWGGIADLGDIGPDSNIWGPFITNDGVTITSRIPTISMTLNIGSKSDYTFQNKIGLLAHEYGHYLLGGGHSFENTYACGGTAQRGLGVMNSGSGGTLAMNPQEKYLLGYTTYSDIFYNQSGTLPDYQSTGTAYRIPIPLFVNGNPNINPDEFFIIANHQKLSVYEFTKTTGIYIYHVKSNFYGHNHMDMITADGLWQYTVSHWIDPRPYDLGGSADWACSNWPNNPFLLPVPKKSTVDRVNGRDDLQEVVRVQYPHDGRYYWWDRWFDEQGIHITSPLGDALDAFNENYNQLFSPWSNPTTYDKLRTHTYTTVQLISKSGNLFNLQFYTDYSSSLSAPPSKPQNLKLSIIQQNGESYPKLTWEVNAEPDVNPNGKYEIWRRVSYGSWSNWDTVKTVNGSTLEFIDIAIYGAGAGLNQVEYKIRAKDTQGLFSVYSDVVGTAWGLSQQKSPADHRINVVYEYKLYENYPNPFNPNTTIQYDIKERGLVKLKVYDILGKEVAELVDEVKDAEKYLINFNANKLPSGVYIYSLSVNGFIQNRKMTLLK